MSEARQSRPRAKRKKAATGDYSVGYCRPPEATRFKPGHTSSKRRGQKKDESMLSLFKKIVAERITIRIGGELRVITKGAAVLYANHQKALQSDQRAMHNLLSFAEQSEMLDDPKRQGGILAVHEPFESDEEWEAAVRKCEEDMMAGRKRRSLFEW